MPLPKGYENREGRFGETWKPKVGDSLHGEVLAYRPQTGPNKQDCATIIEPETGALYAVWITANLENRLTANDVGKKVYIERVADTPMAGRSPMNTYIVGIGIGK